MLLKLVVSWSTSDDEGTYGALAEEFFEVKTNSYRPYARNSNSYVDIRAPHSAYR